MFSLSQKPKSKSKFWLCLNSAALASVIVGVLLLNTESSDASGLRIHKDLPRYPEGQITVVLPPGQKIENLVLKQSGGGSGREAIELQTISYVVRRMRTGETAEVHYISDAPGTTSPVKIIEVVDFE